MYFGFQAIGRLLQSVYLFRKLQVFSLFLETQVFFKFKYSFPEIFAKSKLIINMGLQAKSKPAELPLKIHAVWRFFISVKTWKFYFNHFSIDGL